MARKVFISYRRADTEAIAGRVSDGLRRLLPKDHVFFDVGSIQGGDLFREKIERAVATFDTMIVMIGAGWLGPVAETPTRIWEPDDYVRLEVGIALARGTMHILPIVVEGASIPAQDALPPDVRGLLAYNVMPIANATFERDFQAIFARTQGKALAPEDRLVLLRVASACGAGAALGCCAAIAVGVLHWLAFRRAMAESLGGNDLAKLFFALMIVLGAASGFLRSSRRNL